MLHKTKSKKTHLLKFALVLPLLTLFVAVSSCEQTQTDNSETEGLQTIVESEQIGNEKDYTKDVPFAVIDQVPIYPGCENLSTNEERKQCFSEKISALIPENFNSKVIKNSGLTGRQRITVQFKIDDQGNVVDILSQGPNNLLEKEAKRVVGLIPKMQPGIQDGKAVGVLYSLPIIYEVKE